MKTYYILDTDTNTWSLEHRPLKEITSMPGITGGHLLADARSRQTLTVAQALATTRKTALKAPTIPLLKLPDSAVGGAAKEAAPTSKPASMLALLLVLWDESPDNEKRERKNISKR